MEAWSSVKRIRKTENEASKIMSDQQKAGSNRTHRGRGGRTATEARTPVSRHQALEATEPQPREK